MTFSEEQRAAVKIAFAERGYHGELRVAHVTSDGERVFDVALGDSRRPMPRRRSEG